MAWTTPRTWVSGETLTAALLNTHVRDNLKAIGDAWPAYTPTLSGWTLGNGTLAGAVMQVDKLVMGRIVLTVGSTTTPSGELAITLPVNSLITAGFAAGHAHILDTSAVTRFNRTVFISSATLMRFATEADVRVAATVPMTWAAGDTLTAQFMYQAA